MRIQRTALIGMTLALLSGCFSTEELDVLSFIGSTGNAGGGQSVTDGTPPVIYVIMPTAAPSCVTMRNPLTVLGGATDSMYGNPNISRVTWLNGATGEFGEAAGGGG